ncbi:hypothetical protein D3C87_1662520 [compost metagenome]
MAFIYCRLQAVCNPMQIIFIKFLYHNTVNQYIPQSIAGYDYIAILLLQQFFYTQNLMLPICPLQNSGKSFLH